MPCPATAPAPLGACRCPRETAPAPPAAPAAARPASAAAWPPAGPAGWWGGRAGAGAEGEGEGLAGGSPGRGPGANTHAGTQAGRQAARQVGRQAGGRGPHLESGAPRLLQHRDAPLRGRRLRLGGGRLALRRLQPGGQLLGLVRQQQLLLLRRGQHRRQLGGLVGLRLVRCRVKALLPLPAEVHLQVQPHQEQYHHHPISTPASQTRGDAGTRPGHGQGTARASRPRQPAGTEPNRSLPRLSTPPPFMSPPLPAGPPPHLQVLLKLVQQLVRRHLRIHELRSQQLHLILRLLQLLLGSRAQLLRGAGAREGQPCGWAGARGANTWAGSRACAVHY